MDWGSSWGGFSNVLDQVKDLKNSLEKQLDEAVGVDGSAILADAEENIEAIEDLSNQPESAERDAKASREDDISANKENDFFGSFGLTKTSSQGETSEGEPSEAVDDGKAVVDQAPTSGWADSEDNLDENLSELPDVSPEKSEPLAGLTQSENAISDEQSGTDGWGIAEEDGAWNNEDLNFGDENSLPRSPSTQPTTQIPEEKDSSEESDKILETGCDHVQEDEKMGQSQEGEHEQEDEEDELSQEAGHQQEDERENQNQEQNVDDSSFQNDEEHDTQPFKLPGQEDAEHEQSGWQEEDVALEETQPQQAEQENQDVGSPKHEGLNSSFVDDGDGWQNDDDVDLTVETHNAVEELAVEEVQEVTSVLESNDQVNDRADISPTIDQEENVSPNGWEGEDSNVLEEISPHELHVQHQSSEESFDGKVEEKDQESEKFEDGNAEQKVDEINLCDEDTGLAAGGSERVLEPQPADLHPEHREEVEYQQPQQMEQDPSIDDSTTSPALEARAEELEEESTAEENTTEVVENSSGVLGNEDDQDLEIEASHVSEESTGTISSARPETDLNNEAPRGSEVNETSIGSTEHEQPSLDETIQPPPHPYIDPAILQEVEILRSTLVERERQLESAVMRSSQFVEENDSLKDTVAHLQAKLSTLEEENKLRKTSEESSSGSMKALQAALRKAETRTRQAEERAAEAEKRASGLMEEGLGLSKKLGQLETTMKKMREEKKESTTSIQKLQSKLTAAETEVKRLTEELKSTEQNVKKGEATFAKISSSTLEMEKKYLEALAKFEKEASRSAHLQGALDEAWKEVTEQKKVTASINQELNAARLEQQQLRHQLKEQISSNQVRNDRASVMERSVAEMQQALAEQGSESTLTEESLRRDIKQLKHQLQLAEKRNEDLVSSSARATKPLLRQIEALEQMNQSQRNSYEVSQSSIMARLLAAEKGESVAKAAKIEAEASRSELQLRVAELEATVESSKTDRTRIESQLRHARERVSTLEKESASLSIQMDEIRDQNTNRVTELKSVETRLRNTLASVQERHEQEMDEMSKLHEDARERLEQKLKELESSKSTLRKSGSSRSFESLGSASKAPSVANSKVSDFPRSQESILSDLHIGQSASDLFESASMMDHPDTQQLRGGGGEEPSMLYIQQLKGQVHQKQTQIDSLRSQMNSIERARDALSEELVRVSERAQNFEKQIHRVPMLEKELEETMIRFDALLQLCGEREEEVEELQETIQTMKIAHREQLDQMTQYVNTA